jgi:hypothetical protein
MRRTHVLRSKWPFDARPAPGRDTLDTPFHRLVHALSVVGCTGIAVYMVLFQDFSGVTEQVGNEHVFMPVRCFYLCDSQP